MLQLEINISDGEFIFKEGDSDDALYRLQAGKVKLIQQFGIHEKLLKVIEPNGFFGEMALINPQTRKFSAFAIGDCTLLKIDKISFEKLLKKNVNFASDYIAHLSECLINTKNKTDYFNNKYKEHKLYSALLRELLLNGRIDKSEKWRLVDLNDFVSEYIGHADNLSNFSRKEIMSVIDKMSKAGIFHIKTDTAKNLWIGVRE